MNTNSYTNPKPNPRQTPPQPRRPSPTQSNSRTLWIVGGSAALVVLMVVAGFALLFVLAILPDRIPSGVAIGGVDVGGDTVNEATAALQRNLPAQMLTLTDGDRSWVISPADIGVLIDVETTLQAAQESAPNNNVTPRYNVDLTTAQNGFVALSEQINIDALPSKDGRSMDIPVMLDRLRVDVTGEIADGVFQLDMIITPAPESQSGANYTGETTTHIVENGQELALIARQYGVSIQDIAALNDLSNPDLIYVGQELSIPAGGEFIPENIPAAPTNSGRSIVVSTEEQRIYAYENGNLVRQHLVSTGLPATPTVRGDYRVYVKHVATDMSGPDYFLPQVPYTMYFYQGYGIHGTYWHNAFGRPMSHGCVNLPTAEAQWFFDFASVGTPVRVI